MKDLNKKLKKLNEDLKNNSGEKLNFMANLPKEAESSKSSLNKKKILYFTLFGLISASASVGLQTNASYTRRDETMPCSNDESLNYRHSMTCNDIPGTMMNGHFSSSSYWPSKQCSSTVAGTTHREKHMNITEGGKTREGHSDSSTNKCDVSTNEGYREANALSFNHNGNFSMDNVITNSNLNCRIKHAHNSHASHNSHGSHSSHASHGSHGSHSSHASHASHSSAH